MTPVIIGDATLYNTDCMKFMATCADKSFDLAVVDPPYGIGISSNPVRQLHEKKVWDSAIPNADYFAELRRVSVDQIIWGGNYFLDHLGASQGFLIWGKVQPHDFSLAMCELAWSSVQSPAKMWRRSVLAEKGKIHPTQKPIPLYEWIFANHVKPGQRILDTHLGSGSSAIAANNLGLKFVGMELDVDYFAAACNRIEQAVSQGQLFAPAQIKQEQSSIFGEAA